MKTIRLHKLILRDFQGGTFTLEANGKDVNIFADNGIGKTRLFSAFTWLLFGKDSLNRSDFSLKNLNSSGEVADHGLQHSVEGVLNIDGEEVVLKKVYSEKFVKTRGRATDEFAGHKTQHFINDVPTQEKDYKAYIQDIAGDEQTFRLLTSPAAFPTLPWQKQRSLLLEIFGDVSDADIIASESKLVELPNILGKHTVDDYKKIIAARQAKLTEALGTNNRPGTIETRIDEVRRGLPDVTGLNRVAIGLEISRWEVSINDAKLKLQGVDTGGRIAELSKKLAVLNADIQKMEQKHYSDTMALANSLGQQVTEITEHLNADRRRVVTIDGDVKRRTMAIDGIEKDLETHRTKWSEIDAQVFQDTTVGTCSVCGQSLPPERVQEARDKALAEFNSRKAERLREITQNGTRIADGKIHLRGEIDALNKEREIVAAGIPETETKLQTVTVERDAIKVLATDYTTLPAREQLLLQKAGIEADISGERTGRTQDADKIQKEVEFLTKELTAAKDNADKFVKRENGEKRIEELKAEEKQLASESEKMASELFLIDLFTRIKVNMLNDKMTGQFEIVNWKLAEVQVNGAINDQMCELTVNGVGYNSGLNSAGRTNAGLDVCRTLAEHYGLQVPIFVDNAESVCHLIDMQGQVIRLVVSEPDKVLRVEMAREQVAA